MIDNAAEVMQEPLKPIRELDRIYSAGLLGENSRSAMRRYSAGDRFYTDWEHSQFNPDFRSLSGQNKYDIDRLTATDRYIKANAAITPSWQYFVRSVLIDNKSVDVFIRFHPIFNRTAEEKAVLLLTLQDALDQIAEAYEGMEKSND